MEVTKGIPLQKTSKVNSKDFYLINFESFIKLPKQCQFWEYKPSMNSINNSENMKNNKITVFFFLSNGMGFNLNPLVYKEYDSIIDSHNICTILQMQMLVFNSHLLIINHFTRSKFPGILKIKYNYCSLMKKLRLKLW